jgi:hypothetical protein
MPVQMIDSDSQPPRGLFNVKQFIGAGDLRGGGQPRHRCAANHFDLPQEHRQLLWWHLFGGCQ